MKTVYLTQNIERTLFIQNGVIFQLPVLLVPIKLLISEILYNLLFFVFICLNFVKKSNQYFDNFFL